MNHNKLLPEAFLAKIEQFIPQHLSIDEFVDFCHRPLRKSIRVNTLKISVAEFTQRMERQGWRLTPVPWCNEGFWLERPEQDSPIPLGNTFEHLAGLFYIQEASSMMPPLALKAALESAETVLDVAAAPGSKTTQIAALMNNQGTIIANEFSSSRLKGLHSNLQRCGIKNTSLTHFDGRVFGRYLPEMFDAILLDTPCGGEGTIRKDLDALTNWSQSALEEISQLQKELIESAFKALKVGGRLVYSTCTLSPEENQHVVNHLLAKYPEQTKLVRLNQLFEGAQRVATEEGHLHVWPQVFDSEGFFVACIEKTATSDDQPEPLKIGKFPFKRVSRKDRALLADYLAKQFGYTLAEQAEIFQRDKEFWYFPEQQADFIGKLKCDRMGIKIAELFSKGGKPVFRTSHEFAISQGHLFTQGVAELDQPQLIAYFQGKDIEQQNEGHQGETLISYQGYPVGLSKWLKNKLKSSLPRELVRDSRLIQ